MSAQYPFPSCDDIQNLPYIRYWQKRFRQTRADKPLSAPAAIPFGLSFTFGETNTQGQAPPPGVPRIFVDDDEGTGSPPRVTPLDLSDISNFQTPKKPTLGLSISPTRGDSPRSSSPVGYSIPNSPHLSPIASPRSGSPVSGSPPAGGFRERAGSSVSAQTVLEDALDSSEWGRQIRSYVGRSPSSAGLRNRSTSNAGVRSRSRSRSPSTPGPRNSRD